jgi:hypothetical protein
MPCQLLMGCWAPTWLLRRVRNQPNATYLGCGRFPGQLADSISSWFLFFIRRPGTEAFLIPFCLDLLFVWFWC